MATQVASKKNRVASAQHTRETKRNQRLNAGYSNGTIPTDFKNKSEQKAWKSNVTKQGGLTQQNLGNHRQRYNDLIAAFGRASKPKVGRRQSVGVGGGGLSFSGG